MAWIPKIAAASSSSSPFAVLHSDDSLKVMVSLWCALSYPKFLTTCESIPHPTTRKGREIDLNPTGLIFWMSASAVIILDLKGRPVLSRTYRHGLSVKRCARVFVKRVINQEDALGAPDPVFTHDDGLSYCFIRHSNLYFLVVTKENANAVLLLTFLHRLVGVFQKYFTTVEEESIKDNFVVVYELLDEVADFGYVQTTDHQVLQEFIHEETFHLSDLTLEHLTNFETFKHIITNTLFKSIAKSFKRNSENTSSTLKVPKRLTGIVARKSGIVYEQNEVFVDVVERVNMVVSKQGSAVSTSVDGMIKMNCQLSGIPTVKLGLNDKVLFENLGRDISRRNTVDLDDIQFHSSVRLNKFEQDRTILFRPPDGEFVLMRYRLNTRHKPLFHVSVKTRTFSNTRIQFGVLLQLNFTNRVAASICQVYIPVPSDADRPNFVPEIGSTQYRPDEDAVVWTLRNVKGKTQVAMKGELFLPSISSESGEGAEARTREFEKKPIKVDFKIPYYCVSRLEVRYLKVIEKSGYRAVPLCRYMTVNGNYVVRQY